MTWISHIMVAEGINFVAGLPTATVIAGATAPDWTEDWFGIHDHRGITHWLIPWAIAFIMTFIFPHTSYIKYIQGFIFGVFTHLFCDSLTITGIPIGFSLGQIKLLKGKFKTGKAGEYIFAGCVFFLLYFFAYSTDIKIMGSNRMKELLNQSIIDKREYKEQRWKL